MDYVQRKLEVTLQTSQALSKKVLKRFRVTKSETGHNKVYKVQRTEH